MGNQPKSIIFELSNLGCLMRVHPNNLREQKGSKRDGNLNIFLITISHMASSSLRNLSLEVWKLAQIYDF